MSKFGIPSLSPDLEAVIASGLSDTEKCLLFLPVPATASAFDRSSTKDPPALQSF